MLERRKIYPISIENQIEDQDQYFIKHLLAPYLSQLYTGLVARNNNVKQEWLSLSVLKEYLNLPELLGDRIVN